MGSKKKFVSLFQSQSVFFKHRIGNVVKFLLGMMGYTTIRKDNLNELYFSVTVHEAVNRWTHESVPKELSNFVLTQLVRLKSNSQLQQELLALYISNYQDRDERYFVEFGACDGLLYSNTLQLEKSFNWKGIVAEPSRSFHNSLISNRSCIIETRCIWDCSGQRVEFLELHEGEYSHISGEKTHKKESNNFRGYQVETVSLVDLLRENHAPTEIDYLSIDTEGSEWTILRNFDFIQYRFNLINVEHNYGIHRNEVFDLLSSRGYTRIMNQISHFDDWYVHNSMLAKAPHLK